MPIPRLPGTVLAPILIALTGPAAASGLFASMQAGSVAQPAIVRTGWVTDAAQVLDPGQRSALRRQLGRLEHDTGHQLVVVTVPGLRGQNTAAFARRLGYAWGVGRPGINDGVVLLVAPQERKVRIEVGRGLERILPNARCADILQHTMIPRFTAGEIGGGIVAGVAALDRALRQ